MNNITDNSTGSLPVVSTAMSNSSLLPGSTVALDSLPLMQARRWLRLVLIPLIVCMALLGNGLMVAIVGRLQASRSSMDQYLATIAVSDTLFLLLGPLNNWLHLVTGFFFAATHDVVCKVTQWIYVAAGTTSVWLVVAMTTQRALSVVWPHRISVLCTPKTSWCVIACVIAAASLTYAHMLYGTGVNSAGDFSQRQCTIVSLDYAAFVLGTWLYVDMLLYSLLPFAAIVVANVVLMATLRQSVRQARHLGLGAQHCPQAHRASDTLAVSLTVMAVSLSFVLLTAPIAIHNALSVLYVYGKTTVSDLDGYAFSLFLETVLNLVFNCNFGLNFYLYCLTGTRFRNEFKKLISRWKALLTGMCTRN